MNRFGIFLFLAASVCSLSLVSGETCEKSASTYFTEIDFVDMKDECVKATEKQIETELTASMKYLYMASFFARDSINRPGFAKLFFEAAAEEREHAQKLIEYLTMRGRYLDKNDNMLKNFDLRELVKNAGKLDSKADLKDLTSTEAGKSSTPGLIALQNALKLESVVTKSIRSLVKVCESDDKVDKVGKDGKKTGGKEEFNHYHFVDYLTSEFLEEQYKGQRDLAGKISTLGKLVQGNGLELGEFLFDKQLL